MTALRKPDYYRSETVIGRNYQNKQARQNRILKLKLFGAIAAIITMIWICSIQSQWLVQNEYELWKMKKQWFLATKANDQAKLEVAQLMAPQRIQKVAAGKMGMIIPSIIYQATVFDGKTVDTKVADAAAVHSGIN
jgi:cell division protein FtsL